LESYQKLILDDQIKDEVVFRKNVANRSVVDLSVLSSLASIGSEGPKLEVDVEQETDVIV